MITTKQQALDFLYNKDYQTSGKYKFQHYETFKGWINEMLDEIFIDENKRNIEIQKAYKYLQNIFSQDEMDQISNCLIDTKVGMDEVVEYIKYIKSIDKNRCFSIEKIKSFVKFVEIENEKIKDKF